MIAMIRTILGGIAVGNDLVHIPAIVLCLALARDTEHALVPVRVIDLNLAPVLIPDLVVIQGEVFISYFTSFSCQQI